MQIENIDFQVKTLLLSFAITIVISLIITPILKRLKVGQVEREEGPQSHFSKQGTPTMGGIIIILSTIIVTAGMYIYYYKTDMQISTKMLPLILASIGFGIVGFIDDFKKVILRNTKGLSPRSKILGILLISVAYTLFLLKALNIGTDTYIPIIKQFITIPVWIYIPAAIFIILSTTNAINLTDGVDGLGAGVSTIIITCLTVIGIILDIKEVAVFGSIVIGCGLGFLLFNLNPAKVFMGDTGSLLLRRCYIYNCLISKTSVIITCNSVNTSNRNNICNYTGFVF